MFQYVYKAICQITIAIKKIEINNLKRLSVIEVWSTYG